MGRHGNAGPRSHLTNPRNHEGLEEGPALRSRRMPKGSKMSRILGIETSCDETAVAIVRDGRAIEANVIAAQTDLHARFGGVVPEQASRAHLRSIIPVLEEALEQARADWDDLDAIAVTHGPGLAGALLVGVTVAKGLSFARRKPLLGINHLEGHVYANWLETADEPGFPLVALIVSGGHSDLA